MTNFFKPAFLYLLEDEGSRFTEDPDDSGGATKFGVTQKDLEQFLQRSCDAEDVREMNQDTAAAIYEKFYWNTFGCDRISDEAIATAVLNTCVLYGGHTGMKMAQRALNNCGQNLVPDGHHGPKTEEAFNSVLASNFIPAFVAQILTRIDFVVEQYPKNQKFMQGWQNRANRLLTLLK